MRVSQRQLRAQQAAWLLSSRSNFLRSKPEFTGKVDRQATEADRSTTERSGEVRLDRKN